MHHIIFSFREVKMDEILKEVQTYDSDTLRKKLLEHGVKVGPIAKSTISLFQRRLAKELLKLQGGSNDEPEELDSENKSAATTSNSSDNSVSKTNIETPTKFPDVFYAVCLPENTETSNGSSADELVFSDKALALKTAKLYKGSRFKVFKSEEDAKTFSKFRAETAFQSPRRPSKEETPTLVASESSPFKGPRPQDLSMLKKVIEQGDVVSFKKQVWENPRYLVSGGDTPTIYQEGSRYTAMHVAAIKNKPDICQAILDILEDPQFVNTLYGQGKISEETQNGRINFLVDMYLNMPDKGCCESPLHMACKYGHDQVVEILAAHPQTDRELKNKWGCSPKDLVCSRSTSPAPSLKKKIEELLKGLCYVPLIRSEDNTASPVIGQPWSPDVNKSLIDLPPISHSPIESSLTVKACAGPMSPSDAGIFHKRWTTPPTNSPDMKKAYFNTKRSDSEKGMERIGRQLAHEMHIPWSEYWEFLDQFVDLSSSAGLDLLENYLKKRSWLKFVKDFKDKYFIDDQIEDFQGVSTPKSNRFGLMSLTDSSQSVGSVFGGNLNNNKIDSKDTKVDKDNAEVMKGDEHFFDKKDLSGSDIVSPVTNLSKKFRRLKLNDSWSERATLNSFLESDSVNDNAETEDNDLEQIKDVTENASNEQTETEPLKENEVSCSDKADDGQGKSAMKLIIERSKSSGSDSTASYETAPEAEDESYSSLPFDSLSSEPASPTVFIKLKDKLVLEHLQSIGCQNLIPNTVAKSVVQLKDSPSGEDVMVTIISIPEIENVQQLILLEDLDVESIEGNISSVVNGDIVKICANEENQSISAYLTRAVTLPKCGYIHGPQPTREDLNVSRAIGNALISPECHPNVFNWKISLSKFVRDTNYRWQSPAKLTCKPKIRQSSPLASPLGQKSPITPYRSSFTSSNQQAGVITSDIRTKLFPSIME